MSVLKLFEQQVTSQPDAVAVTFRDQRLTYAQLNERANGIASVLQKAGVGPEALVAVFLERSPELIAGLLGVWKAQAAYLPIEPSYPPQRLAFMLEDSQAQFILTEASLVASLPPTSARILCVEDIHAKTDDPNSFFVAEHTPVDRLAYVIYTSGSTGKPKGVEICHGGLSNVLQQIGADLDLTPSDVVLATATIAFDISNLEIYVPLCAGASIHVVERQFAGDGPKLIEVIRETGATLVFGTPTSWRLLIEAGWQGNSRLQIITGGEVLPLSLARTLAGITRALWNHYGPTETSICATRERIDPETSRVTLGRAIENVQVYVLDDRLKPVAPGKIGEIYIGGAGVGRGYLNRPELTRRSFVRDPFAGSAEARMYKTGDLAMLLPDGRIEFQGRADNQVKVRGFRIELEEIEAAIREYEGVHAAVVQLIERGPDDQRLVSYFLSEDPIPSGSLRDFLRERLPFYMIPSQFIALESLPMTINGKIDREALDAIRIKRGDSKEKTDTPADDLEVRLSAIWHKILKVSTVGVSDNFFEMGGHSLLAARMFAEIERKLGRKIPLSVLIENPTIHQLAAYMRKKRENGWPGLIAIQEQGTRPPLFIAHGLGGSLLLFRKLAQELGPDQPVYGIQLAADVKAKQEELAIESLAERYIDEICAIDPIGPYALAGHSLGGLMVFEIATQLVKQGKKVAVLALLDCDFHVAKRPENSPPPENVPFKESFGHTKAKLLRFFQGNMIDMVWRKIIYQRLMLRIWLLRKLHKDGTFHPHLFGVDPYIALFAERHEPAPLYEDVILYVAKDQPRPTRDFGSGWSQVVRGQLEILKIPGTHQTMFTDPNVAVLAQDLAHRLNLAENRGQSEEHAATNPAPAHNKMNSLFECHGG